MTRIDAALQFNPNRNITEDRPNFDSYSLKQTNIALLRTKLAILFLETITEADLFIERFYYPKFSYFCWASLQTIIFFFDIRYVFTYLLSIGFFIIAVWSPFWDKNISPILERIFFQVYHLHPELN